MVRVNLQKTILLYLVWLAFVTGSIIVSLAGILPFRLGVIEPASAFSYLVYSELFFVLVIWPYFIPKILEEDDGLEAAPKPTPTAGQVHVLLIQVVLLFIFVLPLAFICLNVSDVDLWTFFQGQFLVAVLACFVAALFSFGNQRGWKLLPSYYLGFFVFAAGIPFLYFLVYDLFGASLGFLSVISPFWAASRVQVDSSAFIQCGIFGAATAGLLLGPAFLTRSSSTTA